MVETTQVTSILYTYNLDSTAKHHIGIDSWKIFVTMIPIPALWSLTVYIGQVMMEGVLLLQGGTMMFLDWGGGGCLTTKMEVCKGPGGILPQNILLHKIMKWNCQPSQNGCHNSLCKPLKKTEVSCAKLLRAQPSQRLHS